MAGNEEGVLFSQQATLQSLQGRGCLLSMGNSVGWMTQGIDQHKMLNTVSCNTVEVFPHLSSYKLFQIKLPVLFLSFSLKIQLDEALSNLMLNLAPL